MATEAKEVIDFSIGRVDVNIPAGALTTGEDGNRYSDPVGPGEQAAVAAFGSLGELSIAAVLIPGEDGPDGDEFVATATAEGVATKDVFDESLVEFTRTAFSETSQDDPDVQVSLDDVGDSSNPALVLGESVDTLRIAMSVEAHGVSVSSVLS